MAPGQWPYDAICHTGKELRGDECKDKQRASLQALDIYAEGEERMEEPEVMDVSKKLYLPDMTGLIHI